MPWVRQCRSRKDLGGVHRARYGRLGEEPLCRPLRSSPREGSFQPGTVEKREGHGCGTALQVRGSFASGSRLLFITTNVTIDSVDLHPRKDESYLSFGHTLVLLVLLYTKTPGVYFSSN
jgi:hypothetical protein